MQNLRIWSSGFEVGRNQGNNMEVTHLQIANDKLILCNIEEAKLKILIMIMVLFEVFSVLHISQRKRYQYSINDVQNVEYLNAILGREKVFCQQHIQGCLFGASSQSYEIWKNVVKKCQMKLARWKQHNNFLDAEDFDKFCPIFTRNLPNVPILNSSQIH